MNDDAEVKANPDIAPETKETLEETTRPDKNAFTAPTTQARKWPFKLIVAALLAAAIVVLIGGSVFGYTMWYQNPDKVVHDAVLNAIKANSVSSIGTITYTRDDIKMNISLDGKSSKGNGEFAIAAKVTIDTDDMKQDFDTTGAGRIIEDTLYIKITGVKDVVEDTSAQSGGQIPEYAASIFAKIEDKWISIKASDYQSISEDIAVQQTCILALVKELQTKSSMSKEVADLYRDNQILVIKEELGSKDVNGINSLGYKVTLDKEAASSFIKGLEETSFGTELKKCNEDIDFSEIINDINQEVAEGENVPVIELWISSLGHEITEIAIYSGTNSTDALNILLQPTFNESAAVEVPEGATSLKEVLGEIQKTITEYYQEKYPQGMTTPADLPTGSVDSQHQSAV